MKVDTPLDHAVFLLSANRSRCELIISAHAKTEELASGTLNPFVNHLAFLREQVAQGAESVKLEVGKHENEGRWFSKGTLERFVRFVSTPEVLWNVNKSDEEMSQLEVYLQGAGNQLSNALGGDETGDASPVDNTKKELLRIMDARLITVRQNLTRACTRASALCFTPDTVLDLQQFADRFGAHQLNEACKQFISVAQRRKNLINLWNDKGEDRAIRSSSESDMSIDDPSEESSPSGLNGIHQPLQQNPLITAQQPEPSVRKLKTSLTLPTHHTSRELGSDRDELREGSEVHTKDTVTELPQTSHSRRLSVQDRISMFEKKQEEQTKTSGGKVIVGKSVELRRLSSDVSSAGQSMEKAVLRRWSGASDMSVDVSYERKENESSASTPSTSNSHTLFGVFSSTSEEKDTLKLKDTVVSSKAGAVEDSEINNESIFQTPVGVLNKKPLELKDQAQSEANTKAFSGMLEGFDWTEETKNEAQSKRNSVAKPQPNPSLGLKQTELDLSTSSAKNFETSDQTEDFLSKSVSGGQHHLVSKFQDKSLSISRASSGGFERSGFKDQGAQHTHIKSSVVTRRDAAAFADVPSQIPVTASSKMVNVRLRDQPVNQAPCIASMNTLLHDVSNSKDQLGSQLQSKDLSGKLGGDAEINDRMTSQSNWSTSQGNIEEVGKKGSIFPQSQYEGISSREENTGIQKVKLYRQSSAPKQNNILLDKRDKNAIINGNCDPSSITVTHSSHIRTSPLIASAEQGQNIRPSKGNQELNDELQIKANELEKLFAAHKLRVPGDQTGSSIKSKPAELPEKDLQKDLFGSSTNVVEFDDYSNRKVEDTWDDEYTLKDDLGFSEDSRGKFYDMYTEKRNAKLRNEWSLNRSKKEAKLKAMHDSLECSSSELKAKFAASSIKNNSALYVHQRAERLRSFNVLPILKYNEQLQAESVHSEVDEDSNEFLEQTQYGQGSFGSTKSLQLKRNRNLSSSTPRNSVVPVTRSSVKSANSNPGRRRPNLHENPLAQSVPNFSDFRKENTKPLFGTKTGRSQFRNHGQTRNSNDELVSFKEDKSRRSHTLRKSSAGPVEIKADDIVLTPIRLEKEQSEKVLKNSEVKPFLRRGNGIGPGAGAGIAKLKASIISDNFIGDVQVGQCVEKVEEEDSQTMTTENSVDVVDYSVDSDDDKQKLSKESDNSGDLGSENEDILRSVGQVNLDSVDEVAASAPLLFHTFLAPVQDSPGESPISWNSREHHPFSYTQETSDIDAFADSPTGSPASWNSHSLSQLEVDTARTRKTWGSTQKPLIVANSSSHHQSRKDVAKGFKRLLKFGRKSRGTDGLSDWVSVTTSEGDDDTEDGRDFANRSSEDLRKSRMGFSQEGYNDCELFNEQEHGGRMIPTPSDNFRLREDHLSGSLLKAPKSSFFSLSSFRSKGSEPKHR